MGRIELEKLVANLRDTYGYETNRFTLVGDAALVVHGILLDAGKQPTIMAELGIINNIATIANKSVLEGTYPGYGKFKYVDLGNAWLVTPNRIPSHHCTEEIGPFKVETLSTAIMLFLVQGIEKHRVKITKCFDNGGYLLLEAWSSDIESIKIQYSAYPEYYDIIEDDENPQVRWKTVEGIEVANDDHIFLEYIGMMYVDPN